jgi:hypothetical protein
MKIGFVSKLQLFQVCYLNHRIFFLFSDVWKDSVHIGTRCTELLCGWSTRSLQRTPRPDGTSPCSSCVLVDNLDDAWTFQLCHAVHSGVCTRQKVVESPDFEKRAPLGNRPFSPLPR